MSHGRGVLPGAFRLWLWLVGWMDVCNVCMQTADGETDWQHHGRAHTSHQPPNNPDRQQEYLTVPERFEGRDQKRVREVLYLMYVDWRDGWDREREREERSPSQAVF